MITLSNYWYLLLTSTVVLCKQLRTSTSTQVLAVNNASAADYCGEARARGERERERALHLLHRSAFKKSVKFCQTFSHFQTFIFKFH